MWTIFEKKTAIKALNNAPDEVLLRYEAWKRVVEVEGPSGLRKIKGFHDESLKGDWLGYRSSRLGIKWRVIYRVLSEALEVYVFEVTPHKY
jgi:mRNA-degrading endonuclease YafQ of YafQ-DinJ toxin-antitoxin module